MTKARPKDECLSCGADDLSFSRTLKLIETNESTGEERVVDEGGLCHTCAADPLLRPTIILQVKDETDSNPQ